MKIRGMEKWRNSTGKGGRNVVEGEEDDGLFREKMEGE